VSIQGSTSSGATSAAGGAQDRAQHAGGQAASTAQQAAGAAQQVAGQVAGQARGQVSQQVDQRSTQAGEQVLSVVQDARQVGDTLRGQGQERPAQWVDQIAQRAEGLGEYLRNSDGERILHDVEDVARRQPGAVMGGGLLLGLMASRFLKASSSRRYESRSSGSSAYPPRPRSGYQGSGSGHQGSGGRDLAPAYRPGSDRLTESARVEGSTSLRDPSPRDVPLTGGALPDDPRRDPDFR